MTNTHICHNIQVKNNNSHDALGTHSSSSFIFFFLKFHTDRSSASFFHSQSIRQPHGQAQQAQPQPIVLDTPLSVNSGCVCLSVSVTQLWIFFHVRQYGIAVILTHCGRLYPIISWYHDFMQPNGVKISFTGSRSQEGRGSQSEAKEEHRQTHTPRETRIGQLKCDGDKINDCGQDSRPSPSSGVHAGNFLAASC